jgi:hypothetical protein
MGSNGESTADLSRSPQGTASSLPEKDLPMFDDLAHVAHRAARAVRAFLSTRAGVAVAMLGLLALAVRAAQ